MIDNLALRTKNIAPWNAKQEAVPSASRTIKTRHRRQGLRHGMLRIFRKPCASHHEISKTLPNPYFTHTSQHCPNFFDYSVHYPPCDITAST